VAKSETSLREYKRKRDFARTPEPSGSVAAGPKHGLNFVVQKHAARRLHYDFRLELNGVLKSWAVPRGPSLDPMAKRLAVHVEDHPVEYGGFEGIIPKGEYGGGTVMLWDRGSWEPIGDAEAGYAKGSLKFTLHGKKLNGAWALVKMRSRRAEDRDADNWLLIKERDRWAVPGSDDAVLSADESVATGRDMKSIATDSDLLWSSKSGELAWPKGATNAKAKKRIKKALLDPAKIPGAKRKKSVSHFTPQLATVAAEAPSGNEWLHEIKFDGYRILAHLRGARVELRSRNGLDWTKRFPEIARALGELDVGEALLDGEIVHFSNNGVTNFSALQNDLAEKHTSKLAYVLFDLLYLDGWDLTDTTLEERKRVLSVVLEPTDGSRLRYCDHQLGKGKEFFSSACRFGLEGIVSKRRDALYRSGRASTWLKCKCGTRDEFVVVGFTDPAGAREGFGALLVGYHTPGGDLVFAGKVGTGYSTKLLADLRKRLGALERKQATVKLPASIPARGVHWVKPELVAEVSFADWTRDRMLRQASFQGIREDKKPGEIVLEPVGIGEGPKAGGENRALEIRRDGSADVLGVRITHAERVLYPAQGTTKLDIAAYYERTADWILPHVARRPLSLVRCPEGVDGQHFFQKHHTAGMPNGLLPIEVPIDGKRESYVMIEDLSGLLGLVQLGVLEIHPWGSTADELERPDRLIFDLDPDEGLAWDRVIEAALAVRDRLVMLGLRSFPKTTGGKGLHVVVPIRPTLDWTAAKEFTRVLVASLATQQPALYTASLSKKARRGRIFIDYLRNGRGATAVAAYSTRAKSTPTVSAPLSWEEVEQGIRSDTFTILNLPQRLQSLRQDPWKDFAAVKQAITPKILRKLQG